MAKRAFVGVGEVAEVGPGGWAGCGENGEAIAGLGGHVGGGMGAVLMVAARRNGVKTFSAHGIVGQGGIEPNVWYRADAETLQLVPAIVAENWTAAA